MQNFVENKHKGIITAYNINNHLIAYSLRRIYRYFLYFTTGNKHTMVGSSISILSVSTARCTCTVVHGWTKLEVQKISLVIFEACKNFPKRMKEQNDKASDQRCNSSVSSGSIHRQQNNKRNHNWCIYISVMPVNEISILLTKFHDTINSLIWS